MDTPVITEPPKLDQKRLGFSQATLSRIMVGIHETPEKGRDLMLDCLMQDSADTREVMDWLQFHFIRETGGTVERGTTVDKGKVQHMAIFKLPTIN